MAKKKKSKVKRSAKKAMKAIRRHKPESALVALGGLVTSILSSERLRSAVEDLLESWIARASKTGTSLVRRSAGDGEQAEPSPAE